jgi:hypothetical protein
MFLTCGQYLSAQQKRDLHIADELPRTACGFRVNNKKIDSVKLFTMPTMTYTFRSARVEIELMVNLINKDYGDAVLDRCAVCNQQRMSTFLCDGVCIRCAQWP